MLVSRDVKNDLGLGYDSRMTSRFQYSLSCVHRVEYQDFIGYYKGMADSLNGIILM